MANPTIVVAHESEPIREAIRRLCLDAGYTVHAVPDGQSALAEIDKRPAALVLDVALPSVHAYEVVEEVKRRAPETRIVLVASIYNRTGYKRRPTSLYGADDYVEQHHIPDALLVKLERLIGPAPRAVELPPAHVLTPEGEKIRDAGEGRMQALPVATISPKMLERAERLARLIVADIALYNGDALDAAIITGTKPSSRRGCAWISRRAGCSSICACRPRCARRRDFIAEALAEIRKQRRGGSVVSNREAIAVSGPALAAPEVRL